MRVGMPTFRQKMMTIFKFSLPYLLFCLFLIVNLSAFTLFGGYVLKLPMIVIGIFYWALFRPKIVPAWMVFLFGLLVDIFSGLPLGLNALIFVLLKWLVRDQRHVLVGQSFWALWVGFSVVFIFVIIGEWSIMSLFARQILEFEATLWNYALGVLLFPPLLYILNKLHSFLPEHGFGADAGPGFK